jgi:hypothetical protein
VLVARAHTTAGRGAQRPTQPAVGRADGSRRTIDRVRSTRRRATAHGPGASSPARAAFGGPRGLHTQPLPHARPLSVIALDEPDNHLDLPSLNRLADALEDFPGALLLVSHDAALAARLTRSAVSMDTEFACEAGSMFRSGP